MASVTVSGLPYYVDLAGSGAGCNNGYTMKLGVDIEGRLIAYIKARGNNTAGSCYPLACMHVTYLGEDA